MFLVDGLVAGSLLGQCEEGREVDLDCIDSVLFRLPWNALLVQK